MGACSSKPKTTEFEGSTDPSKKTDDVGADRSIDAVDAAQVSQQNEPGKEDKGVADEVAEAVQETRELIASRDKEPLITESLSTAEGVSHSVKPEFSAGDEEAGDSAAEKGKADAGDASKVDAGDGAADYKEVSNKAATTVDGVGGDRDKVFEDKAVVLDEASNVVLVGEGGAYIDKAVAAGKEKGHESSDKGSGNVTAQDEELSNLQEARGVESPIIGVVQPIHVDDVSESVLGSATPETAPAPVDFKVSESPDESGRDVLTSPNIGEDSIPPPGANLSGLPQEAPEEKEEVLHDDSNASPLLVSLSDDGVGQESGVDVARGEEAFADAQDETILEDATKPETFECPQNDIAESTSEPQKESSLEESARGSPAEVTKNEGDAGFLDEPEPEAPTAHESIDTDPSIEPKAETTLDQANEGQGEGIVDEPNASGVQPQALASEETAEDGKPEATPGESIAEPSAETAESSAETDKAEEVEKPPIEEATTNELKVESVDAGNLESPAIEQAIKASGEGDLSFEDASDVPLKVESSTTESGDKPNS